MARKKAQEDKKEAEIAARKAHEELKARQREIEIERRRLEEERKKLEYERWYAGLSDEEKKAENARLAKEKEFQLLEEKRLEEERIEQEKKAEEAEDERLQRNEKIRIRYQKRWKISLIGFASALAVILILTLVSYLLERSALNTYNQNKDLWQTDYVAWKYYDDYYNSMFKFRVIMMLVSVFGGLPCFIMTIASVYEVFKYNKRNAPYLNL